MEANKKERLKNLILARGENDGVGFVIYLSSIPFTTTPYNGEEILFLGYYPNTEHEQHQLQVGIIDENESFSFETLETLEKHYPTVFNEVMEDIRLSYEEI